MIHPVALNPFIYFNYNSYVIGTSLISFLNPLVSQHLQGFFPSPHTIGSSQEQMATHPDKPCANSKGYQRLLSLSSKYIGIRNLGRTIFEGTPTCPPPLRPTDGYWSFQDFELTRLLGDGSLSTVVAATSTKSHFPVAIKVYHRDRLTNLNHRQIAREIEVHAALLPHPNIIALYAAFEDAAGIYLVQELAPSGDLYGSLFKRGGYFTEAAVATTVLPGVLAAITHAHSLGILHRDIKSENILIASNGTIKLADFGLAINLSKDQPVSRVGTLDYMPPEIVALPRSGAPIPALPHHPHSKTSLPYGLPADIWCIGILVYELLVGVPPFETASKEATYIRIAKVEPSIPGHLSEEAKSFLTITLQKEPKSRPTIMQLISHSWLVKHQSVPVSGRGSGVNAQQQQQQQEGVSASSTSSSASSSSSAAGGSTGSKPILPRQKQSSGCRSSSAFNWKLSSTIKQLKAKSKLSNDEDDTNGGYGSPPCQTIKAVRQPENNYNNINVSFCGNKSSPLSLSSSSSPRQQQQPDSPRKSRIFAKLFNGRKSAYSTTTMVTQQQQP